MGMGEPASSISHMVGGGLSIVALVAMVLVADGALAITSAAVFGVTLLAAYSLSAIYHAFPKAHAAKKWLRRMDHVAIFLLIAGTYTPVVLVGLGGAWGWSLFGVVWGLAILGIVLKLTVGAGPKWIQPVLYITLGWMVVVAAPAMLDRIPTGGLLWLLAGGIVYSVGAIIYATHKEGKLWGLDGHDLWHFFVLGGSICHVVAVMRYVL